MHTTPAPQSLKEKQRQERETLILKAAEEILVEKGYHETSMDEIAARVGVAKGTVYLHFPSKENLLVAIFERDMQQFLQSLDEVIVLSMTNREKLEALLQFFYGGLFSKRTRLLYAIATNADLQRLLMAKEGCMRDLWRQLAERVTNLLDAGKASGEFDTSIPSNVMMSAFFSLLSPRSYERLVVDEQMPATELVGYLGQIYFKGIAIK